MGYGERFGIADDELRPFVGRLASRDEVIAASDVVLLPKPQVEDLRDFRDGQVLWGWPHLVQDAQMTQLSIDKRLTVIAFEAMNHWGEDGAFGLHVFHKNNELAGYCSVLHALELCGSTGDYGRRLTAVVIGFGATARGAVTALRAHGVHEVRVLTNRRAASVAAPIHAAHIIQFDHDDVPYLSEVITDDGRVPLAPFLAESDIVVNCTLQDPNHPLLYLRESDLDAFRPGSLIVDVSCDEGMGFEWARPTSFADPMFTVGGTDQLLRSGPQSFVPVELRELGDQRSAASLRPDRDGRTARLGAERDDPAGDRDRGRRDPQSRDTRVPVARFGISASGRNILTQAALHEIHSHA